jgi:AraC-like DNA-binding protein
MSIVGGNIKNYFASQIYGKIPGLGVSSCGHWKIRNHILQDRTREDFLVIYCVAGSGIYIEGKRKYKIKAGTLFAAFPDISHSYWCDEPGWEIWYAHFGGDIAGRLLDWAGLKVFNPIVQVGINNKLLATFGKIITTVVKKQLDCEIDAAWLLYRLLLQIRTCAASEQMRKNCLQQALDAHTDNIDEMAKIANMSKFHFIREFKKAVGITPWQYVIQRKITIAKELLHNHSKTIKQIAYEVGFSDPDYFSTIFKKRTGLKPQDFRGISD